MRTTQNVGTSYSLTCLEQSSTPAYSIRNVTAFLGTVSESVHLGDCSAHFSLKTAIIHLLHNVNFVAHLLHNLSTLAIFLKTQHGVWLVWLSG